MARRRRRMRRSRTRFRLTPRLFPSRRLPIGLAIRSQLGARGTFTCTLNTGQTITSGSSVNFPLVVKVNAGTTSGSITNTPSVASTVGDPNSANNSTTVTTIVASPTQADVSIVKTAAPEPVNGAQPYLFPHSYKWWACGCAGHRRH